MIKKNYTRKIRGSNDWSWIPWWEPWVPRGCRPLVCPLLPPNTFTPKGSLSLLRGSSPSRAPPLLP